MDIEELQSTHEEYNKNRDEWLRFKAAYEGTKSLIDWGALKQNNRESQESYGERKRNAYSFNYTSRIVSIINSYIFQKPSGNNYGKLGEDEFFQMFLQNADLQGKDFGLVINDNQKWASVYGHIGLLVDKPQENGNENRAQDLDDNIYPFITSFNPLGILDWETKNVNGRSVLSYLKLLDDDGTYRIWTRDSWKLWKVVDGKAVAAGNGINPLDIIPFVWMTNEDSGVRFIGKSDVKEISRMDIAILRLLSGCEEIFNLAMFPMLMKPYVPKGLNADDTVGASNVVEFDPKNPQSKPEWLKTAISEPIQAVSDWISGLVTEMYKQINANGLNTSTGGVKSGDSLQREFAALNAFLAKKAKVTVMAAEKDVIYFWLKWQGQEDLMSEVSIDRDTNYDITSMSDELDNITAAKNIVQSETFNKNCQKLVARKTLPTTTPEDEVIINDEIETGRVPLNLDDIDNANNELGNNDE